MNLKFLKFKPRRKKSSLTWREIIPNMVTSGNIISGVISLVLSFHGYYAEAGWAIFAAVFFDFMDGVVARMLSGGTQFGIEFDSIADVVSFGAAPALLFYGAYLQDIKITGVIAACLFSLCGGLRLARFNVVHSAGSFQGIPIPAAGLFISSFIIAGIDINQIIAALLMFSLSILMVSKVPYGNLKTLRKGYANRLKFVFVFSLMFLTAVSAGKYAPVILMSIYVASGLLRFDWGKWLSLPAPE
ncbi:MAG: CDP-diacylglycerol--serine O-phosphatidyltransferase [Synergistaceae bacterium]|nr:CDP-diacylglycerol--serine O-phosphatidyltransferase [Synergistaceae bacterium]